MSALAELHAPFGHSLGHTRSSLQSQSLDWYWENQPNYCRHSPILCNSV